MPGFSFGETREKAGYMAAAEASLDQAGWLNEGFRAKGFNAFGASDFGLRALG